jgi:hypothetical protein
MIVKTLPYLLVAILILAAPWTARAVDDTKPGQPLSEAALIKLSNTDIEDEIVVAVVKTRGVAFKANSATIKRLRKAGVADAVLALLKPVDDAPKTVDEPKPADEPKPSREPGEPLGTGNLQQGLVIEVMDVQRTSDDFLRVSFRIRNPTKERITYTISGVYFVPEMYYVEVGGDGKKYLIVRDGAGNYTASHIPGTVTINPRESVNYWAKFSQPGKNVKKISLYFRHADPIEDISLPPKK